MNWLGSKISQGVNFLGQKAHDALNWIGQKAPIIHGVATVIRDIAKPVGTALSFIPGFAAIAGSVANRVGDVANWVSKNTEPTAVKNHLEKGKNIVNSSTSTLNKLTNRMK